MKRKTFDEMKRRRLEAMNAGERAAFDAVYDAARLAIEVGDQIRQARETAEMTQRQLARVMGTSQAAVARLEAGGTSATLTTLHKAAAALDLRVTVAFSPAD